MILAQQIYSVIFRCLEGEWQLPRTAKDAMNHQTGKLTRLLILGLLPSVWLFGSIALSFSTSASAQDQIIGVDFGGNLYQIDPVTGTGSALGNVGFAASDMARSPNGDFFAGGNGPLIRIDRESFQATIAAPLIFPGEETSVRALAFSPAGVLYAVNNRKQRFVDGPDNLYTINPETGTTTLVGNTGFWGIQSIAFSPSGVLYGWEGGTGVDDGIGLVIIDPLTGIAMDVNPLVGASVQAGDIQGLTFSGPGVLYGGRDSLYSVDLQTGVQTLIGSGGYSDLRGIAFVPEPSPFKIALFGVGAILLIRTFRKRLKASWGAF